jgi:hypothetical protein
MTAQQLKDHLANFYGTECYHRHSLIRNFVYTDGVKALAEGGSAYWLIDAIASHQPQARKIGWFQVWSLDKQKNGTWLLVCRPDSGQPAAITQKIEFSDFPMDSIQLWVEQSGDPEGNLLWVLLLPSEH